MTLCEKCGFTVNGELCLCENVDYLGRKLAPGQPVMFKFGQSNTPGRIHSILNGTIFVRTPDDETFSFDQEAAKRFKLRRI